MFWCKKKPKVKYKKMQKEFNIGKTAIHLELKDGRQFTTHVYGYVYMGTVSPSISQAQELCYTVSQPDGYITSSGISDDPKNPTKFVVGEVIGGSIGETVEYKEMAWVNCVDDSD